jgi:hypothetical protein
MLLYWILPGFSSHGNIDYIMQSRQELGTTDNTHMMAKSAPLMTCPARIASEKMQRAIMLELLADEPKRCANIYAACLEAGISERTVDTAKREIGVKSMHRGDGWYWALQV